MEFSLGRDTLPSQARSVRGESRRLRRERDNAKKLFPDVCSGGSPSVTAPWPYCDQYSAQTDEPPLTLSLSMITCQGTTQARKPDRAYFDIGLGTAIQARTCPLCKTGNRRREPGFCRLPPRATAGPAVWIISMAVRDHASLVTHRNRNLARTTVINSSQRRTCATMLALTSH